MNETRTDLGVIDDKPNKSILLDKEAIKYLSEKLTIEEFKKLEIILEDNKENRERAKTFYEIYLQEMDFRSNLLEQVSNTQKSILNFAVRP